MHMALFCKVKFYASYHTHLRSIVYVSQGNAGRLLLPRHRLQYEVYISMWGYTVGPHRTGPYLGVRANAACVSITLHQRESF